MNGCVRRLAAAVLGRRPMLAGGPTAWVESAAAPLNWRPRASAPVRTNLLIPAIDLTHLFGGYLGKFSLARRLAEQGHRVRLVTVGAGRAPKGSWRDEIEAYDGLSGLFSRVEVVFGREAGGIEVSPSDRFIATVWPSAHVAAHATLRLGRERFGYLVQEYEPFTHPMGAQAALAAESYTFPHVALFSTDLLLDYFRRHRLGVYAEGGAGDGSAFSFQNPITRVEPPTAVELARRTARRLLFYARPEPHAARNMFELGMCALSRAVVAGGLKGWEVYGIGTVGRPRSLSLGRGVRLHLLPRTGQRAYAELLRRHDVGLALMYTPHPSLVPIEMAAAGLVTVTNTFENKTAEAMAAISPNLHAVRPTADAVTQGLLDAVQTVRTRCAEHRIRGSAVAWSRDWDEALPDRLLARFTESLETGSLERPPG